MVKTTKTKTYDTATAAVVKKVVCGAYGDPAGYEMTMYQTPEGDFFLYTNGGEESPYKEEASRRSPKPTQRSGWKRTEKELKKNRAGGSFFYITKIHAYPAETRNPPA